MPLKGFLSNFIYGNHLFSLDYVWGGLQIKYKKNQQQVAPLNSILFLVKQISFTWFAFFYIKGGGF